jgi:hypothetical protein
MHPAQFYSYPWLSFVFGFFVAVTQKRDGNRFISNDSGTFNEKSPSELETVLMLLPSILMIAKARGVLEPESTIFLFLNKSANFFVCFHCVEIVGRCLHQIGHV